MITPRRSGTKARRGACDAYPFPDVTLKAIGAAAKGSLVKRGDWGKRKFNEPPRNRRTVLAQPTKA